MESKNKKMKRTRRVRAPLDVNARIVSVSSRKGAVAGNALNSLTPLQRQGRLTAPITQARRPPMIGFPVPQPIITPQGGLIQPTAIQALEQSIAQLTRGLNMTNNLLYSPPQQNFTPVAPRIQAQALNAMPQGVAQPQDQAEISQQLNMAGGSSSMLNLQAPIGSLQSQAFATNTPRPQTQSLPVIGNTTAKTQNIQPLPSITQLTSTPDNVIQLSTADNAEFNNQGGVVSVEEPKPRTYQPVLPRQIAEFMALKNKGRTKREIMDTMNINSTRYATFMQNLRKRQQLISQETKQQT